jgi:hypothetical protein
LSSPKRLLKVEFAEALCSFDARAARAAAQAAAPRSVSSSKTEGEPLGGGYPWRSFSAPRLALQWGFAATALALLLMASYLLFENSRLRKQTTEAQRSHEGLEQELQRQLSDRQAANAKMAKELDSLRESQLNLAQLKIFSALLLPPTRGAGQLPRVLIPRGSSLVVLLLTLESQDFPVYRVGLKDPATNQIVWRSANLEALPSGGNKTVSISFPARLLKQQNYVVELSGVSPDGRAEFISGYPIRVVIE